MPKIPNVILLMTDQQRADMAGFLGHPVLKTPHLDSLASAGVIFDNAFVQCPVCMASRAAIHTGRYPRSLRMPSMGLLPPDEITLAETLKRNGYVTGMFGKLHFTPQGYTLHDRGIDRPIIDAGFFLEPTGILSAGTEAAAADPFKRRYGFDVHAGVEDMLWGEYLDWLEKEAPSFVAQHASENWGMGRAGAVYGSSPPARRMFHPQVSDFFDSPIPAELAPSAFIVEKTLEFIRANRNKPFFAHCSFVDPHHPFNAPEPFNRMYDPKDMPVPPSFDIASCYPEGLPPGVERKIQKMKDFPPELWQWGEANYLGMVSHIDWCVGRLMEGLRDLGLADDTIIVYTSDHGEYVGDHRLLYKGSLLFDSIMKVPFSITWPAGIREVRRVEAMVQEIDIYPTVMRLLGLPVHKGVQGMDLVPLMTGATTKGYDRVYCELDDLPDSTYVDCHAIRSSDWKLEYFPRARRGLLYNLREDPGELTNLFDDSRYSDVRHSMMMDLLDHLFASKDPLPIRLSQA